MSWHLAQLNVARMRAPIDSETMAGFVARLDDVNAAADEAPGFVWRLQTDDGDATGIRAFPDDMLLVNLSVWESPEALRSYVYGEPHRAVMRKRAQWFERMEVAYLVLWWVPAGHVPSVEEAKARLETLRAHGAGPDAFTLREVHPPGEGL